MRDGRPKGRDAGPVTAARRAAQQPGPAQRGHAQRHQPNGTDSGRRRHRLSPKTRGRSVGHQPNIVVLSMCHFRDFTSIGAKRSGPARNSRDTVGELPVGDATRRPDGNHRPGNQVVQRNRNGFVRCRRPEQWLESTLQRCLLARPLVTHLPQAVRHLLKYQRRHGAKRRPRLELSQPGPAWQIVVGTSALTVFIAADRSISARMSVSNPQGR